VRKILYEYAVLGFVTVLFAWSFSSTTTRTEGGKHETWRNVCEETLVVELPSMAELPSVASRTPSLIMTLDGEGKQFVYFPCHPHANPPCGIKKSGRAVCS